MNETGILYTSPMVRALLAGSKTQTRRVAKPQPANGWDFEHPPVLGRITSKHTKQGRFGVFIQRGIDTDFPETDLIPCPYGEPGDFLWVRETFYAWGYWEVRHNDKKGRDEWHFVDITLETGRAYRYAADGDGLIPMPGRRRIAGGTPGWWKRPAIHMPRVASRIALEITALRVERLNDISEADAQAEGAEFGVSTTGGFELHPMGTYGEGYAHLWESINSAGSWGVNPQVWVVEFKVVKP